MASVVRSLSISQVTRGSSSSYNQYGAWITCSSPFYQKPAHLKLRDISSFSTSNSLVLITKAQLASASTTTTTEKTHEDLDSTADNAQETLDMATPSSASNGPRTPTLPKRYAHLSELLCQLCAGVDVPSAMDPWLQKLSLYEWNQLVVECGHKDWKTSIQIVAFFREKETSLDQIVLFPQRNADSIAGTLHESSIDSNGGGSEETVEAVLETPQEITLQGVEETILRKPSKSSGLSTNSDKEEVQQSSGNTIPALKLYTTLANLLGRKRLFEEVDHVQLQMKEAGIEPDRNFYNVLLDSHVEKRSFATAFEILQEMKSAGFEPHHYIYDKLAFIYMNQENPDMGVLKELAEDLKERRQPVCIAIYKRLLRAHWEAKDVAGAEEAYEAMLAAGYTPELKVLLKVMQLNGRRGNHERVVELSELIVKLGIKPNASVYDYLVHAYCKSGLPEKATETLLKYESVLGTKPTTIALNMLIDGYGKQGLHEEAHETFEQIRRFGYRPTEVSYSSIISAMAQVGKIKSAAQLYARMLKEGIQPNLHTYLTLIRSYSKCNQTREGHKIYDAMRKSPVQMTEAAYSTSLALYVEGTWYHHAAALLKEIEENGKVLDAAAHSALIRSFSFLESKTTPLVKAVQESEFEICKLLTALFQSTLERQKLTPELIEETFSLLEEWKEIVSLDAKALVYNAFMDYFWRKGYKEMAKKILDLGREVYVGYSKPRVIETEWVVDVRGLGVGGAKVALTDSLSIAEEALKERSGNVWKMVVITGDEFSLSLPQDNRAVKQAIKLMLTELGSPFVESQKSSEMEASLADILKWLSQGKVKEVLSFTDSC